MAGLGDLFGSGGTIEQLFIWGLLNQVIGQAGQPALTLLANKVNSAHPVMPLAPPDLADAVVRNYMSLGEAASEAAKSGIDADRFQTIVHLHGDAPAPGDLATALRRGIIPETGTGAEQVSFDQGIREGRLSDKWTPMMKALSVQWPSPTDALQALLEGQVTKQEAEDLYHKFGGDPQYFDMLFNTRGSAPTPLEATQMAIRGIITWDGQGPDVTSFHQAFLEGPWRDKWEDPYRQLAVYVPPESTVGTLLSHGAITDAQAAKWWQQNGMSQEDIAAFTAEAHLEQLSDYRGLTQSSVLNMYYNQMITAEDARKILTALHVYPQAADLMLTYADLQRSIDAVNKAVTRIGTLYAARKITRKTAIQSLSAMNIPGKSINGIIETWDLENSITVKNLTETQIIDAVQYQVMTADEGLTALQNIGYTPYDAWVLLSVKAKQPLPGKPSPGPAPPQGAVVPGVT
jgi:hypothetical protein